MHYSFGNILYFRQRACQCWLNTTPVIRSNSVRSTCSFKSCLFGKLWIVFLKTSCSCEARDATFIFVSTCPVSLMCSPNSWWQESNLIPTYTVVPGILLCPYTEQKQHLLWMRKSPKEIALETSPVAIHFSAQTSILLQMFDNHTWSICRSKEGFCCPIGTMCTYLVIHRAV